MNSTIYLIGTGQMAVDYAKVLQAQQVSFNVIGRGLASAESFAEKTGIKSLTGGWENYLSEHALPPHAYIIIATGAEVLMPALIAALNAGAARVLIEKPAALSIEELMANEAYLTPYNDRVFVAYNRRYYASVIEAQRLIDVDGGLQSMLFEFTEWAHRIESNQKSAALKENWFFANSTHIVDLAFFLAGKPLDWHTYNKPGKLSWHKKTNFVGAGITEKGVLFSYLSNWESAGRWAIELLTEKRRIYLKPLEGICVQNRSSISVEEHGFDDSLDKQFKPGLYKQVEAFLADKTGFIPHICDHINNTRHIYSRIID